MVFKPWIANPCCKCGTQTKNIAWVKGKQKPICEQCLEENSKGVLENEKDDNTRR